MTACVRNRLVHPVEERDAHLLGHGATTRSGPAEREEQAVRTVRAWRIHFDEMEPLAGEPNFSQQAW